MRNVGSKDFYDVRSIGFFPSSDIRPLIDFYLPLIGATSLAVYLALREDRCLNDKTLLQNHEKLFAKLALTPGQFSSALSPLEAIGLIKTYMKESSNGNLYSYCLYSVKSPSEFLDDPLLTGSLIKAIGKDGLDHLKKKYRSDQVPTGYTDASISFNEYFTPDMNDLSSLGNSKDLKGRHSGALKTAFDLSLFMEGFISKGGIRDALSKKEIETISKLSTLFAIDSFIAGEMTFSHFEGSLPLGKRVDIEGLKKDLERGNGLHYLKSKPLNETSDIQSHSDIAVLVKQFESFAPAEYLKVLQHNKKPAQSDLRILETLSLDIGLPDSVINVLINYCLRRNDNMLIRAYVEKVGAALVREGAMTAIDAMNYLNKITGRKGNKSNALKPETIKENKKEEISDEEINDLLDSLDK